MKSRVGGFREPLKWLIVAVRVLSFLYGHG